MAIKGMCIAIGVDMGLALGAAILLAFGDLGLGVSIGFIFGVGLAAVLYVVFSA